MKKINIKTIMEKQVIEQEFLNDNCLYVKTLEENEKGKYIYIYTYHNNSSYHFDVHENIICCYPASKDEKMIIEKNENGLAVFEKDDINNTKKLIEVYDATETDKYNQGKVEYDFLTSVYEKLFSSNKKVLVKK